MTNSHNATSTKSCFSGILRRLLCTGSLPTHPSDSDHLPELDKTDFINYVPKKHDHEVKGGGTPGVVARLMGLDSLPADMTWVPSKDSIHFRSRPVNSADYLSPFDPAAQESYHRRVRTSVSFREIPTTFLVCFDKNGDDQKTNGDQGLKIRAAQVAGSADQVKRYTSQTKTSSNSNITSGNKSNTIERVVVVKKKENQENNEKKDVREKRNSLREVGNNVLGQKKSNDVYLKSSIKMRRSAKPVNLSTEAKVSDGMKRAKERVNRRNRAKKVKPEHVSSPDSVAIISGNSGTRAFNPAKKNPTPKVVDKCFDYPCVNSVRKSNSGDDDDDDDQEVRRAIHITKSEKLMRRREIEFYMDKLVEVCRLTDEDAKVSPNNWPWISSRSDQVIEFGDFQDICFDFGQEILEVLVQQVVDELCKRTVESFFF